MTSFVEETAIKKVLSSFRKTKQHIAVSLTNNCPLKCSHCIVSANHGTYDERAIETGLTKWLINGISKEAHRLSFISFTGGESSLAPDSFYQVGSTAAKSGIKCGIITSGYFAKTTEAAFRFLDRNKFISHVSVSVDEHHEKHLPIDYPLRLAAAAQARGLRTSVRYSGSCADYLFRIKGLIEKNGLSATIEAQDIAYTGRAKSLEQSPTLNAAPLSQCFSTGPHISSKGYILPCCSDIVSRETNELLGMGHISSVSFTEMLDRFEDDAVLSVLRLFGWDHIIDNIAAEHNDFQTLRGCTGCEKCRKITFNPTRVSKVKDWLQSEGGAASLRITAAYEEALGRGLI